MAKLLRGNKPNLSIEHKNTNSKTWGQKKDQWEKLVIPMLFAKRG